MQIEQTIGNLLLKHNCVIIPSFGGFVAKQVAAEINETSGTMLPPRKSLLFNIQLISNDGLLINSFAQENHLTYEAASREITMQVLNWRHKLQIGERVTIDKVGHLYLDAENNLGFQQDRFYNLLLQSYGLSKIHFIAQEDIQIAQQQVESATIDTPIAPIFELKNSEEIISEDRSESTVETPVLVLKPKRRALWKYAAAAALLPIGFYSFWIPLKTPVLESGLLSIVDFNPFKENKQSVYTYETNAVAPQESGISKSTPLKSTISSLPNDVKVYSYKLNDETYIPVKVKESAPHEAVVPVAERGSEVSASTTATSVSYGHYVIGCFENEQNANVLVASLKKQGFDAYIIDYKNHLYRVSGGKIRGNNFSDLKSKLDKINLSGWVLR